MNNIIEHYIRRNFNLVLEKSLKHCHTKGLHSIMLHDEPENRLRLYIATEDHDLWKNTERNLSKDISMSIGFHSHHCDLTLIGVNGTVTSHQIKESKTVTQNIILSSYKFDSKINGGTGGFEFVDQVVPFQYESHFYISPDRWCKSIHLKANQIHTVSVEKEKSAVWLVIESRNDGNYQPITYSNDDLTKFDSEWLYQKFDNQSELITLLNDHELVKNDFFEELENM